MVFVHGVRFDAMTNRAPSTGWDTAAPALVDGKPAEDPYRDAYETGSGFGYALEDPGVPVPRDRDAVREQELLPHLAAALLAGAGEPEAQQRTYELLRRYPNGLESRIVRWASAQRGVATFRRALEELGRAALAEFRQRHGPAAFAVDRPLEHLDLDGLRAAGLEPVDLAPVPTLAAVLRDFGGHPDLGAAVALARAQAERAAVDVQLEPRVRHEVDAAAAELGRVGGVGVVVRTVGGPHGLVRRHVTATAGCWHVMVHWERLDPAATHRRLGGCPARNRAGGCSCAFVATVREVLGGARDAAVLDADREQSLLWSMLALGAAAGDASSCDPPVPAPPGEGTGARAPKLRGAQGEQAQRLRQTSAPGDVVEAGPASKAPATPEDRRCLMGHMRLIRGPMGNVGGIGVFLEDAPAAWEWAHEHAEDVLALQALLAAIVAACRLQGGGVHAYVTAAPSQVMAFHVRGTVFVSARAFAALPRLGAVEAGDRVFGWVKHELAHSTTVHHDVRFIGELEEVSHLLDPEWFHSHQRASLERGGARGESSRACWTQ